MALTRELGRNEQLRVWVGEGADTVEIPLSETVYVDALELERSLAVASHGSWGSLVITSARAASAAALARVRAASDVELFSVGAATTAALHRVGLEMPRAQSSAGALALAAQIRRSPVLVLGAKGMRTDLSEALVQRGLEVDVVACYETRALALDEPARAALAGCDVVFVGAPSAWAVARDVVACQTWVVVPGATTAEVVRESHERVLEGWGPSLGVRLAALSRPAD